MPKILFTLIIAFSFLILRPTAISADNHLRCPQGTVDPFSINYFQQRLCTKAENDIINQYCCRNSSCGEVLRPSWNQFTSCSEVVQSFQANAAKLVLKVSREKIPANLGFTTCDGVSGVNTAIGCVPTGDPAKFLSFILRFAFAISGAVILIMTIATGYMLLTSSGNPEKLQAAKENIVSLFSGIILIVFSLVLLQTVGADILKLPTF